MFNLSPWYYRNLLVKNDIINFPEFYEINLLDGKKQFEAAVSLNEKLRPDWISTSEFYRDCDGSGASEFKNVAVYKAISEALERLAFYELAETQEKKFSFDLNPTTTGMAAFPSFNCKIARDNGRAEAIERWAIHEFNQGKIPIKRHNSAVKDLESFELVTPFVDIKVILLAYKNENFYAYSFAAGKNVKHSYDRALVELGRNIRVLKKAYQNSKNFTSVESAVDKTILFFSTFEGNSVFSELIKSSPEKIKNSNPKILCDQELKGYWSKYTKVWRFLLEDSYFNTNKNHKFFMF